MAFIGNQPTAVPLTSSQLADGLITTAKLATDAVTTAKLASTSVTTAKVNTAAITTDKLDLISTASVPAVTAKGTPSVSDGYIQLNCEQNSHGIKLKSPPHSAAQSYTLTFPSTAPTNGTFLQTDGSGVLSFATPAAGSFVFLAETSASNVATVDLNGYFTSSYDYYQIYLDDVYGNDQASFQMQFSTGGGYTVQTSSYYSAGIMTQTQSGPTVVLTQEGTYNGSSMTIIYSMSNTSTQTSSAVITIFNPMGSNVKNFVSNSSGCYGNIGVIFGGSSAGRWNSTTAITGVRFKASAGNIYARKIRIYGVKNS